MVCLRTSSVSCGRRLRSSKSAHSVISRFCGRLDRGVSAGDTPFTGAGDEAVSSIADTILRSGSFNGLPPLRSKVNFPVGVSCTTGVEDAEEGPAS